MTKLSEVDIPEWRPLEAVLAACECADFMYMGRSGEIVLYKHSRTRRYLNIDRRTGCFYRFVSGQMCEIDRQEALDYVYG